MFSNYFGHKNWCKRILCWIGQHKVAPSALVHVMRSRCCVSWWFCHARFLRCFYVVTISKQHAVLSGSFSFFVVTADAIYFWYSLSRFCYRVSCWCRVQPSMMIWIGSDGCFGADASLREDQPETYASHLLLPTGWWLVDSAAASLGLQSLLPPDLGCSTPSLLGFFKTNIQHAVLPNSCWLLRCEHTSAKTLLTVWMTLGALHIQLLAVLTSNIFVVKYNLKPNATWIVMTHDAMHQWTR